jgi:radical SAM protein with 4Fe4S-binding SPASM domain
MKSVNRNVTDIVNLLGKLTVRRFINFGKVLGSYYASRITGRARQWGLPVSVSIEPTTSCNLRCPECPSGLRAFSRPTGMLEPVFYRKTIDALAPDLLYLILYFQGEPYLNKNLFDIIAYAASKKIYTATSTNAHYLNDEHARKTIESGLDRLIISIDGTTQDTYEQYRIGGKLNNVLTGAANMVKWKKALNSSTPYLVFQFLVVKPNEHQVEEVERMAAAIGIDEVVFKTAQLYDYAHGNELMPDNEKFSRYKKLKNGTFAIKNPLLNHCWKLWHSCVITWDGKVVPCCFDKDATHRLGDLQENAFSTVWQGDAYNSFRQAVLNARSSIDICTNCTEGTRVWA